MLAIPCEQIVHLVLGGSSNVDSINGGLWWQADSSQQVLSQYLRFSIDRENGDFVEKNEAFAGRDRISSRTFVNDGLGYKQVELASMVIPPLQR